MAEAALKTWPFATPGFPDVDPNLAFIYGKVESSATGVDHIASDGKDLPVPLERFATDEAFCNKTWSAVKLDSSDLFISPANTEETLSEDPRRTTDDVAVRSLRPQVVPSKSWSVLKPDTCTSEISFCPVNSDTTRSEDTRRAADHVALKASRAIVVPGTIARRVERLPSRCSNDTDNEHWQSVREDRPRRWRVWLVTAVATLAIQFLPLVQTNACSADWSEDGTTFEMSLLRRFLDHPRYGAIHLVQHCVYLWTAAALFAVNIDHRGRYEPSSGLQRWTWYYACTILVRALGYWSLSLVVVVCPKDAVLIFKCIEEVSNIVQIISYFIFNYVAVLKLWVLQLPDAARLCCALLYTSLVLILVHMSSQLLGRICRDWIFHMEHPIYAVLYGLSCMLWMAGNALAAHSMLNAARAAKARACAGDLPRLKQNRAELAAWWTRITALATAMSCGSTALMAASHFYVGSLGWRVRDNVTAQVIVCTTLSADHLCNAMAAAVLCGYLGPAAQLNNEGSLALVGAQVVAAREQRVKAALQEACSKRGTAAAAIQSLVDGGDPDSIFEQAKKRFRRIPWPVLREAKHLMAGGTLDGKQACDELYMYSEPCSLSECDAFLSHSWHDDFELKWAALALWCENFYTKHSRYPMLWVDKFCINQCDVAADLQCLPVFLAGCNSLLIVAGLTYTTRLWCVMELYLFIMMQSKSALKCGGVQVQAIALGESSEERRAVKYAFVSDFDAEKCQCHNPADKERIMAVIQQSDGGVHAFNIRARQLARSLMSDRSSPLWQRLPTITSSTSSGSWVMRGLSNQSISKV